MAKEKFETPLPLADIQGLIIRGYNMDVVRHFILQVADADAAKTFIGSLVGGDPAIPQITSAEQWDVKPDCCLNIAFTYEGMRGLKLPPTSFDTDLNYQSFKNGAVAQAATVNDTGDSAPQFWVGKLNQTADVHVVLSLYAMDMSVLEEKSKLLRLRFADQNALTELSSFDGNALPEGRVHFGYIDGISQPTIEGGPPRPPDQQPTVPPYLIYLNNDPAAPYMPPKPAGLLVNGSFGAFRILEQDVVGFENLLKEHSNQIDPEELAAKMCGRWRTGTPLALSPDSELPVPPETEINNYDYITYPVGAGDAQGLRCPIGSHMRRNNPRSEDVAGDAHGHRITRRAIPYGPAYDPNKPYDGIERGLVGFFIGAVLWNQFEFLMSTWVNTGNFSINSQPTGKDPVLGSNSADSSVFDIPQPTGNLSITGFPRFVTTKGSAYCFFPGITALKCIGGQLSGAQCQ